MNEQSVIVSEEESRRIEDLRKQFISMCDPINQLRTRVLSLAIPILIVNVETGEIIDRRFSEDVQAKLDEYADMIEEIAEYYKLVAKKDEEALKKWKWKSRWITI